jgi:hypothetical protein
MRLQTTRRHSEFGYALLQNHSARMGNPPMDAQWDSFEVYDDVAYAAYPQTPA